mgnify:CR=1 FL=1|jgi:hypothetical protein
MDKVIAFCAGLLLYWFVTGFTQQEIADKFSGAWQQAYEMGKADGYKVGKAEYAYVQTREWLESKCMFFDWENSVEKK